MTSDLLERHLREALRGARERARRRGEPILATVSAPIEAGELIPFFASSSGQSPAYLWLGTGDHSILGLGAAWEITAKGNDRFLHVAEAWQAVTSEAFVVGDDGPIALGGFRFDPQHPVSDLWRGFPDASLIIPRVALRVSNGKGRLIISDAVETETDVDRRTGELLSLWSRIQTRRAAVVEAQCGKPVAKEQGDAKKRWAALVNEAVATIGRGDLEKVVTARTLDMEFPAPIEVAPVLRRLREANPAACIFAFGRHGACFAGATPETLLILEARSFRTMALAGSISRSQEPEEDRRLGEALLASAKDRREHDLVARTLRQALAPLCTLIDVDEVPRLHRLPRLQHLMTRFSGTVRPGTNLIELIGRLHPTPAVGGVALGPALAFLRANEDIDRGWYASPVGWIDTKGSGEFMVSLRSALLDGRCATLFAGCGLVAGSEPESEYRETQLKFQTMLDALDPNHVGH